MSCFVPSCSNTIGVTFPKSSSLVEKWLKSLNLKHLQPHANNFVCFDHFRESDFLPTNSDSLPKVRHGSIPILGAQISKDIPHMCRVCMSDKDLIMDISELLDGIPIMSILMLCCYPIKMSLTDNLPKDICKSCLEDLKIAHKLRLKCLNSVKKIQIKIEKHNSMKRKLVSIEKNAKKQKFEHSKERVVHNNEELDSSELSEFIKIGDARKKENLNSNAEEPEESIENIKILVDNKHKLSEFIKIDDTKMKMEKVTNNDLICDLTNTETEKKSGGIIGQKILLSKMLIEKFTSPKGFFPCSVIPSFFGNPFIEADQYIYIIGLVRNGVRNIHCIQTTCKAYAEQNEISKDQFEDRITIIVPHNHPIPSESTKKKRMLLHAIRKRMQQDKSLNVKHLFEEFCKLDSSLRTLVPLRLVITEICKNPIRPKLLDISTFEEFYENIDSVAFSKLHFTMCGQQFFQEKFMTEDGDLAVIFCKVEILQKLSHSKIMYVDASFKIDTNEDFKYQLVTVLLWVEDSYYPVLYAFVNRKSLEIFKEIFQYVYEKLAPDLRPTEIVTDFEANIYHALGEIYIDSHIGGSVFYFTQNMYKKVCSLNLSRDLETNSYFRSIYHMLLMLPLLPVNTISDGFSNIEEQARDMGLTELVKPLFNHVKNEWMSKVTPDLFCVHRLENRINENVIAPFKKLRDFLLVSKGKATKQQICISQVVEKVIELEAFLSDLYTKEDKKSFGRDLSCSQKKNVLRAWLYIETHPKININNFFTKVLGYIKCMENQLWIWGFYGYIGDSDNVLINASHFSIVSGEDYLEVEGEENVISEEVFEDLVEGEIVENDVADEEIIIMEAVLDDSGKIIIQNEDGLESYLEDD